MGASMVINNRVSENSMANSTIDRISPIQRYQPPSLEQLTLRTKFTKKEIQCIYQGFKQECPSGLIDEETFQKIYQQFFPFADTSLYAHLIFSTIDLRATGWVTFEDFLLCLSTLCRGTMEDRLKWIFTLYDTNKCGKLTRQDFHAIISAVYSLLGYDLTDEKHRQSLDEYTRKICEKFNCFEQGYLTWEAFLSFCSRDSMILQSIESLRIIV